MNSDVTELTSVMVDETAFAILKKNGSGGITILSSQRKFMFDMQVDPYRSKWQTKCSKLVATDIKGSKFHHDMWNRYLMLQFVSAHIPWHSITNLKLQRSNTAWRSDLVLPSTMTHCNNHRKQYALTVDGIKQQLPSQNTVSLVFDGWTSAHNLAIPFRVIAAYVNQNWTLRKVQLALHEVHRLLFSTFKS